MGYMQIQMSYNNNYMPYETRRFKASLVVPIPSLIKPIPRIDTYFFLRLGLPKGLLPVGLPVKILKALHSGYMTCPSQSSTDAL